MGTAASVPAGTLAAVPSVERIRNATLQVIPNARHLTFVEQPSVIADLLSEVRGRHKD
jgi:pimeloyl-ACP methyl ester carboxylesterase